MFSSGSSNKSISLSLSKKKDHFTSESHDSQFSNSTTQKIPEEVHKSKNSNKIKDPPSNIPSSASSNNLTLTPKGSTSQERMKALRSRQSEEKKQE